MGSINRSKKILAMSLVSIFLPLPFGLARDEVKKPGRSAVDKFWLSILSPDESDKKICEEISKIVADKLQKDDQLKNREFVTSKIIRTSKGWTVMVTFIPKTPGAFALFLLDEDKKVYDKIAGR